MKRTVLAAFASMALLAAAPAVAAPAHVGAHAGDRAGASSVGASAYRGLLHKAGQCQQRVGPFATQSTAWQRWRQAGYAGYSTSNGVVPCYDGGYRGYCFFVFYGC